MKDVIVFLTFGAFFRCLPSIGAPYGRAHVRALGAILRKGRLLAAFS